MRLKFPVFVDPRYSAEQDVEIETDEVESVEETTRGLLLGGSHKITLVTLASGRSYALGGHVQAQIEGARRG